MVKTGVIHGRFQVLHNDHLKYLLAGKKRCEHLVVGITNPDPVMTKEDKVDLARSSLLSNPLTYYERQQMVRSALAETGLTLKDFCVVPFPINFPELYKFYVPMDAVFFLTIYDAWGERKLSMFSELGLKTDVLWRCKLEEKGLSSTDIRSMIANDEKWQPLVPKSVAKLIKEFDLKKRLKN